MDTTIRNKSRGTVLHDDPRWATTVWQQAKGMMFTRPRDECIIFLFLPARRVSFHMWFVFAPIDAIALDGTGRVVALKEKFLPWTFWYPYVLASAVIELPAGRIKQTKTAVGDLVVLPKLPVL